MNIDIDEIIEELNTVSPQQKKKEYIEMYKLLNKDKYDGYLLARKELRSIEKEKKQQIKKELEEIKKEQYLLEKIKKLEERKEKNKIACRERYRKNNLLFI